MLPTVEARILRIEELAPDFYFSDKENNYISLDTLVNITIASSNYKKGNSAHIKELIEQILPKQIEKKDDYAAPKNIWFRDWRLVENFP